MHQAALATMAKLRWLLGRSAVVLSEKRLADLTLVPLGNRCLEGVVDVFQQGQVFRLTSTGLEGTPLWAYRYRVGGRDGKRVQRGGFASEGNARALAVVAVTRAWRGKSFATSTA
jgi:hypothetical protein